MLVCAQTVEIPLSSPGHLGMISNIGASEQPLGSMRYSLNVDVFSTPGVLKRRVGLQYYGGTNLHLYGATGYYNPYDDHKLVVGVHDSTFVWFDSAGIAHPSLVGHFLVSDTFTTNPDIGVSGLVFPYRDAYHDWLPWRDMLFHCDGKTTPIIFTTSQTFVFTDSADTANDQISTFDTLGYEPRVVSLGLEAPGQLRVGLTDLAGPNSGEYRYAYAYWDKTDSTFSRMSRYSAAVSPKNEIPYLTQFEKYGIPDTVLWKLVLRQKQDGSSKTFVIDTMKIGMLDTMITNVIVVPNHPSRYPSRAVLNYQYFVKIGAWDGDPIDSVGYNNTTLSGYNSMVVIINHLIDSLATMSTMVDSVTVTRTAGQYSLSIQSKLPCQSFTTAADTGSGISVILDSTNWNAAGSPLVYLDTMPDGSATVEWCQDSADTSIRTPGSLTPDSISQSGSGRCIDYDSTQHAMLDSVYHIAYSYYDPTTGLESPLGPTLHTILADSVANDSIGFRFVTTGWPADGRPQWIRLWQGAMNGGTTGAGDTMYWYGLYQIRISDSARQIIWGNWSDTALVTILDTSKITADTVYDYQLFVDASGTSIMRPPYVYDLQIPFTQMRYAHFRFYGIPPGSNCIYFTPVDTISWSPFDYFEIEPGADEFVAIEELYGTLYAFKHNSIWFIAGFEAELETPWGRIIDTDVEVRELTSAYGVVSRETVCKYDDAIYFLTPTGKVMVIDDQGLSELSAPIQDRVDSLLSSTYKGRGDYGWLYGANDAIKLVNDSTHQALSYHIPTGTWGEELTEPSSFMPIGSFLYDSTEGLGGVGDGRILWTKGTTFFKRQRLYGQQFESSGNYAWQAEFVLPGDGVNLWSITGMKFLVYPFTNMRLRYTIYDGFGDSLVADSLNVYDLHAYDSAWLPLNWHMKEHQPVTCPVIRLWTPPDCLWDTTLAGAVIPNRFEIESIIFTIRNHGSIYAQ